MIAFEYKELLWLLLLIPLLAALYQYSRYKRSRQLERFGKPSVIAHLMPDASKYMPAVKLAIELAIVLILVLLIARPLASFNASATDNAKESEQSGMEIMVCVDVSNSMMASATDDPDGASRMDRAQQILETLVNQMNNDKIGLVAFAGEAYLQLPISNDLTVTKTFIKSLHPNMIPTQGTAIGAAIKMAVGCFNPKSEFAKAIIVLTDGENFEDDAVAAAKYAKRNNIRVDVIGLGTEQGAPIIDNGRPWIADNGQMVISKLNKDEAEKIAAAGGGIYVAGDSKSAVSQIENNLSDMARKEYIRINHTPEAEQFPVLAWIALILLVIDVFVATRKISWLRKINFFSKDTEGDNKSSDSNENNAAEKK